MRSAASKQPSPTSLSHKKRPPQDTLEDDAVITVITRLAKQRKDSIDQFTKGNRPELAEKEKLELAILEEYLPQQLSIEEIKAVVEAKMTELGVSDRSKMGLLMGALMKDLKGKADGKLVKEAVDAAIGG